MWAFHSVVRIGVSWRTDPGDRRWRRFALIHELGHSMGLGHVAAKGQVMYGGAQDGKHTTYRAGDRAGLAASNPHVCAPDLSPAPSGGRHTVVHQVFDRA